MADFWPLEDCLELGPHSVSAALETMPSIAYHTGMPEATVKAQFLAAINNQDPEQFFDWIVKNLP